MTRPLLCFYCGRPMRVVVVAHRNGRVIPHPVCPVCVSGRVRPPVEPAVLRLVTR